MQFVTSAETSLSSNISTMTVVSNHFDNDINTKSNNADTSDHNYPHKISSTKYIH